MAETERVCIEFATVAETWLARVAPGISDPMWDGVELGFLGVPSAASSFIAIKVILKFHERLVLGIDLEIVHAGTPNLWRFWNVTHDCWPTTTETAFVGEDLREQTS